MFKLRLSLVHLSALAATVGLLLTITQCKLDGSIYDVSDGLIGTNKCRARKLMRSIVLHGVAAEIVDSLSPGTSTSVKK